MDNNKFKKFMEDQPFDDINLNLDSKYFDFGIGYDRQKGTKLSATIDLNSIGQVDENELIREKLKLERDKLEYAKAQLAYAQKNGQPTVKPMTVIDKPKVDPIHTPVEESTPENYYGLSAKAFIDDEDI